MHYVLKKWAVTIFAATVCSLAFAQNNDLFSEDGVPEAKPYKVYCEIIAHSQTLFSNKTIVDLDFGQQSKFFSNDRRLVDETGKAIKFNSMLDAMNFMAERGWVFEQAYVLQSVSKGDSGIPQHHWILSKTVKDSSEITEGLLTAKEVSK